MSDVMSERSRGMSGAAPPATHGCASAWSSVYRFSGSFSSNPDTSSRADAEICVHWVPNSSGCFCVLAYTSASVSAVLPKGTLPERKRYRLTPSAHTSAAFV